MENIEIAKLFNQVADILEIQEENPFRIRAYRKAAQVIESLPQPLAEITNLEEIPGIGKGMAEKIKELLDKGESKEIERLKKRIPQGVLELMQIEGLGPKTVKFLYQKFRIKSIPQLEKLVKAHKLEGLKGFGRKTEENILRGIELYRGQSGRFLLGKVYLQAQIIKGELEKLKEVNQIELAGSVRRMKETIGDLDILITSKNPEKVMDFFTRLPQVREIEAKGRTKSTVILKTGLEADLRVVEPKSFGAALHYFTGSKAHNIRIRKKAQEKNLKINEYGVFKKSKKNWTWISGRTEEEIFKAVNLPWIPPELREDRGEIEAAEKRSLPKLVELDDLKGDLHVHTNWSDGLHSILEMAEEAKKAGYQYLAIADHTKTVGITHGLDEKRLLSQIKEIEKLNKQLKNFRILSGVEVDIRADGKLDLPDKILAKLDLVIGAIHTGFRQDEEKMTKRIISALRNPHLDIIAHPTGRIIGKRPPYALDLEKIMKEAKILGKALEINAFWNRLDLNDIHCRMAKEFGIKLSLGSDAHNKMELSTIKFGLATARRGWLEAKDLINTLSLEELKKEKYISSSNS
jgi:DNA polymerase (family 10)